METWVEAGDEAIESEMEPEMLGDGWTKKGAPGLLDDGNDCRGSKVFRSNVDDTVAGVGATENEGVVEIDPETESVVEISFAVI
jgi:hypothetical protein